MKPGAAAAFAPPPEQTPETLREELEALRRRMEPFLAEIAPLPESLRRVRVIGSADWRLEPESQWERVALPHYGGPIGPARSWYRMRVDLDARDLSLGSVWACFGGVDYRAAVFFNGQLAGTHEGFFSPFDLDVTPYAREGHNEILVRVDNDAIHQGNNAWGDPREGDKLYGATGLGWDEPGLGWHHCPPGMGIHRPVRIEARPRTFVQSVFVRPLPDESCAEARVEIFHGGDKPVVPVLRAEVHGRNFAMPPAVVEEASLPAAGRGFNRYIMRVPLPEFRQWSLDEPWLYRLNVRIEAGGARDAVTASFGMRSFVLDESPGPDGLRGRFLLNGRVIRLRGANTMGHEQQCVLRGDSGQLRDDILLAKLCNLNFLRFTQRPVEPEVYDMCDRLGMMAQTDLPLFAYLRRNQFAEAVRQAVEMERLIRGHASCVLVSFINEPFPAAWGDKSHRHLTRPELESFFTAATAALRVENPDRQVKPIDGDYDPPGPGLPDSHCYAGWYNGHMLDLGKLHKGFWLESKPGWNCACGEFGSEGLDPEDLMRSRYPAAWLPQPGEDPGAWTPARIAKAQTGDLHMLWFEAGRTPAEWVRRSQEHQAWITRLMTQAFRRNNRMVSFAIHLLIDAWPAGWMKSVMDCRRHPKPAYFACREALAPLAVSLRMDRTAFHGAETAVAEVWVCQDGDKLDGELHLAYQLEAGGEVLQSGRGDAVIQAGKAVFQGRLAVEIPMATKRERWHLRVALLDEGGHVRHSAVEELRIHPSPEPAAAGGAIVLGEGKERGLAAHLPPDWFVCSDPGRWAEVAGKVENGATALFVECPPGEFDVAGDRLRFEECGMGARHFVARNPVHPLAASFEADDFRFWFDAALGRPSPLLHTLFFADDSWTPILLTAQGGWGKSWRPALAAAEKRFGRGRVVVCQATLAGRLDTPVALAFLRGLGEGSCLVRRR